MGEGSGTPRGNFGSTDGALPAGGAFPGFGPAPPTIAPTSSAGAAATASRSDHTHAGVYGLAPPPIGQTSSAGIAFSASRSDHTHRGNIVAADSINTSGTKLSAVDASGFVVGSVVAWVATVGDYFGLQTSALTVDHKTVETASGLAGAQWVRLGIYNRVWQAKTAWVIDPTNSTGVASDENLGTSGGAPLLTYAEHARRLTGCFITAATAVSVLGAQQAGDVPAYSCYGLGSSMTFTGTPTVLHTGTVTSYTAMTFGGAPTVDDAQLGDTGVSGGSWTAAGALARGVLIQRTNGTVISCYALKDLGGTTLRVSQPINLAANTTQPAFAAGDSYQIQQLPALVSWRSEDSGQTFTFSGFDVQLSGIGGFLSPRFFNCYVSRLGLRYGSVFINCCYNPTVVSALGGSPLPGTTSWIGGAWIGTGATRYALESGNFTFEGNIVCLQGAALLHEIGISNFTQVNAYDCTTPPLQTGTGARMHLTGVIGGKGNTSQMVKASQASQIVWTPSPVLNVGSTSDPNPFQAGSTTSAAPIPLDANMNGVFQTT